MEEVKNIPTNEELVNLNPDNIEIDMALVEQFVNDTEEADIQDSLNEDDLETLCEAGEVENVEV